MDNKPTESFLSEHGINWIQYQVLAMLNQTGPVNWPDVRFKAISGQAGQSLRTLVERGLITGPERRQKIGSVPFALSEQGTTVLGKVERGLHPVNWLSEHKWTALARLVEGPLSKDDRGGIKGITLHSLTENGYVAVDGDAHTLTDLGREAWAEALADNRRMCRLCQSSLRAYTPEIEVAGQPCFVAGSLEHYHPRRNQPATIPVTCRQFSHVNGGKFR